MEELFLLPVIYKGKEQGFEAQLQLLGYTYKFKVLVEGIEVFFERVEERGYRAKLSATIAEKEAGKIDKGLLQAIAEKIEEIL